MSPLLIVQVISGIILSLFILLQAQGAGLGKAWGGGGEFYRSRRGVEKILFRATIAIAFLFLASSLLASAL